MKIKLTLWLLPIFSLAILSGCTVHKKYTYSYITTDSAPMNTADTNAQAQVAEAATAVGHSLEEMSAIDLSTHPKANIGPIYNAAQIGMAQMTSVDWYGPVEPLVRKIAASSHYKVRILGIRPAIPVIVSMTEHNVPLATILRNTAYQIEKKASIEIYPSSKVIELQYHAS